MEEPESCHRWSGAIAAGQEQSLRVLDKIQQANHSTTMSTFPIENFKLRVNERLCYIYSVKFHLVKAGFRCSFNNLDH